jgi:hypothetical protein
VTMEDAPASAAGSGPAEGASAPVDGSDPANDAPMSEPPEGIVSSGDEAMEDPPASRPGGGPSPQEQRRRQATAAHASLLQGVRKAQVRAQSPLLRRAGLGFDPPGDTPSAPASAPSTAGPSARRSGRANLGKPPEPFWANATAAPAPTFVRAGSADTASASATAASGRPPGVPPAMRRSHA